MAKKLQARKHPRHEAERKYVLGIDPGLGTTALVMTRDDIPLKALAIHGPRTEYGPAEVRARMLAAFCGEQIQRWVDDLEIEDLFVHIELPFFRDAIGARTDLDATSEVRTRGRNVRTFMSQMTLHGMLCCVLSDIDINVHLGVLHNGTAKAMFTGRGNASKMQMISASAWCKRPDVADREHLADAQAIACARPDTVWVSDAALDWMRPSYIDSSLGKGKAWTRRWPRGGRSR